MSVTVEDAWCQLYFVQVLRKEPLNIENRIGHAYPTSLYRLVYDRVAESPFRAMTILRAVADYEKRN